jgi:hypothetical protein
MRGSNAGFTSLCCVGRNTIVPIMVSQKSDRMPPRHGSTSHIGLNGETDSKLPLYEGAAQIVQQCETMKRTPRTRVVMSPSLGSIPQNTNRVETDSQCQRRSHIPEIQAWRAFPRYTRRPNTTVWYLAQLLLIGCHAPKRLGKSSEVGVMPHSASRLRPVRSGSRGVIDRIRGTSELLPHGLGAR